MPYTPRAPALESAPAALHPVYHESLSWPSGWLRPRKSIASAPLRAGAVLKEVF